MHLAAIPKVARSRFPFLTIVLFSVVVSIRPVFAVDECGGVAGGIVTCSNTGDNPYAGGITYDPVGGIILNVESGIVVNRTPGVSFNGVQVRDSSGSPLTVNLADAVARGGLKDLRSKERSVR